MALLLPEELHLHILVPRQVVLGMDMEKAVATIIEEEGVLLMVVVVVGLQVTSTEVEGTGGAGHLSRDRKDTAG